MTRKYPRLTKDNLVYWYWLCDPKWSMIDIAEEIGCTPNTVRYHMVKHDIEIRSYKEASKNMWQWESKRELVLDGWTEEIRKERAETMRNLCKEDSSILENLNRANRQVWDDPHKGKIWKENIGKANKSIEKRTSQSNTLKRLHRTEPYRTKMQDLYQKRRFKLDEKEIIRRYTENYESAGEISKNYNCSDELILRVLKRNGIRIRSRSEAGKITQQKLKNQPFGKNQKQILKNLYSHHALFTSQLYEILKDVPPGNIDKALIQLYRRGVIERGKEFNKNHKRVDTKYQFKYSLTESGLQIIKEKIKIKTLNLGF